MEQKIIHILQFNEETLKVLKNLTKAIENNNNVQNLTNAEEFAREVCANIYANILIENKNR